MEELISDITKQQGTQLPGHRRQNLSSLLKKKIEWGFKENTDNSIFISGKPQWNVKFPWDPLTSKEDSGMKVQHIWSISLLLLSKRVKHMHRHTHTHILSETQTQNIKGSHQHIKARTSCSTCYMRTQWMPTSQRSYTSLYIYIIYMCVLHWQLLQKQTVTDRDNSQVSDIHAHTHKCGHVWHSAM